MQAVREFLMREIQIATGTITNGTARGAQIGSSISLPSALLSTALYTDKLSGFQGIRGTIRIRLVVNGTDMHFGGLRSVILPLQGFTGMTNFWTAHTKDMLQLSYQRGTYMNYATDRELVDLIPCLFAQSFYDLTGGTQPSWAQYQLWAEQPLNYAAGASTSLPYTVYASFMPDVELVNPTYTSSYGIARRHGAPNPLDE